MDKLNETQYLVLTAVMAMSGDGYSAILQKKIQHHTGAIVPYATLHRTLALLEEGKLASSGWYRIRARRGRRTVRIYRITEVGEIMLENTKTARRRIGLLRHATAR